MYFGYWNDINTKSYVTKDVSISVEPVTGSINRYTLFGSNAHVPSANGHATYHRDRPVSIKQSPVITCCRGVGLSSDATRALRDGQIGRCGG